MAVAAAGGHLLRETLDQAHIGLGAMGIATRNKGHREWHPSPCSLLFLLIAMGQTLPDPSGSF